MALPGAPIANPDYKHPTVHYAMESVKPGEPVRTACGRIVRKRVTRIIEHTYCNRCKQALGI